ncbi:MAG TPA: hypothetical protein VFS59_13920 [Gemmatimonadaceae bacterium]|nr:hypothetical protein [Gemmatimonadaceae bacterium]
MIDPRILSALVLALLVAPSVSHAQAKQAGAPNKSAALSPELASARDALAKYADPIVAVRDGFFSTVACVDFPHGGKDGPVEYPPGAMGVHFLNPANVGPVLDPAKPQVLLYEQVGGKLKLTGAEWFMPVAVAGDKAPMIFGQTLLGPMDGHEPIMPASLRHYDLHVWLWKDNPRGVFTSTNAAVKCDPKAPYTSIHGH